MPQQFERQGHTVTLTDQWNFKVTGPEFDDKLNHSYESARQAQEAISKRVQAAEKEREVIRRVGLEVLGNKANRLTIRGINRTDGSLLGGPGNGYSDVVYPSVDWLADILRQAANLRQQFEALDAQTRRFAIRSRRYSGHVQDATNYEKLLAAFENELAEKTADAIARAPKDAAA